MTDELTLYDTDREAWLRKVTPLKAAKIPSETDEQVSGDWSRAPTDYKAAVWQHLDETEKERVRRVRGKK